MNKAVGSEFTNEIEKWEHISKIDSVSDCLESGSQFSRQNMREFPNMIYTWEQWETAAESSLIN